MILAAFPPGSADPVRMRIAYLTDVLTARTGLEQRRQLRGLPGGELAWSTGPLHGTEAQHLAGLIYAGQADPHAVPLWPFPRWLAQGASVGATVIYLSAGPGLLWFGAHVALVRAGQAEIRTISSITGDPPTAIHLAEPLQYAWPAGSTVYPAATGYLRPQQQQTWHALATAGASLTLDIPSLGELDLGSTPNPPELLGVEVLDVMPNRVGPEEDLADRIIDALDPRTGTIWIDSPADAPVLTRQSFAWTMLTEAEVLPFIAFLERRRGQAMPLLAPSWQQDLTLAAATALGATQFTVQLCGYTDNLFGMGTGRRMLALRPPAGAWSYHDVTASVVQGSVERLTINPPAPVAWPLGTLVSFLRFCRLERDDVEIDYWRPGAMQAELALRELAPPSYMLGEPGFRLLWVASFPDVTYSTFEITDLDPSDGHTDIIGVSGDNTVWILDPVTGAVRHSYNPHSGRYDEFAYGYVCCVDVNGDGKKEIIWGSHDGYIRCMSYNLSTVLWTVDNWYDRQVPPVATDEWRHYFQNGPTPATIGGMVYLYQTGYDSRLIRIRASDGVIVNEVELAGPVETAPAIKDIDGDGYPEIIVVTENRCECYEHNLALKWRIDETSTPSSDYGTSTAAIADINGDGYDEIIFTGGHWSAQYGKEVGLFVVSRTGTILAFKRLNTWTSMDSMPTVHNLLDDGDLEIISNDDAGKVYCTRWNVGTGTLDVVWQKTVSPSPLNCSPLLLDVNADGFREIVMLLAEGRVLILAGEDGETLTTLTHGFVTDVEGTPTGGDLNGDGQVEFLVPLMTVGKLLCYQAGESIFAGNWFRRWGFSAGRTGFVVNSDQG